LEKVGYDRDFRSNDLNRKIAREIELEKITSALGDDLRVDRERGMVVAQKRIDTTGIAKGYTVDEAAQFLAEAGFRNFVVDAGGDMYISGKNNEKNPWRIGIEGIDEKKLMLELSGEGIATSGIDRKYWTVGEKKYHHLINPLDPENFSYEIKTVSVVESRTVEADGKAKVLVLMGIEKGLEFANRNNIKTLFLDYKGNIYLSDAIKRHVI
jgi:thiamine biosynthesis lipoprotein